MRTLTEINKGCGESYPQRYNDGDRNFLDNSDCNKYNGLCPQCQALKEQMEGVIKLGEINRYCPYCEKKLIKSNHFCENCKEMISISNDVPIGFISELKGEEIKE